MPLSFDLNNLDGLDDALANAAIKLEEKIGSDQGKRKIRKALQPLRDAAQAKINVITGHLKSAVLTYVETSADAPTEITVGVSYKRTRAHHAHLVEGGHGGNYAPPHPFWEPAVKQYGTECVNAVLFEILDEAEQSFMSSGL